MQKRCLWLAVFLLAVYSAGSAVVENSVNEKLDAGNEVDVIVVLREGTQFAVQGVSEKDTIRNLQDKVLEDFRANAFGVFNNDFQLKNRYSTLNMLSGKITRQGLERLRNNKYVESVAEDKKYSLELAKSPGQINATKVYGLIYNSTNVTGAGVTVCVIDTGIDYTHPALGGCTTAEFTSGTCGKVIGGYDYEHNDNDPWDDQGHGTHVAGIVASENGTYTGIAYGAKLVALKVCDNSSSGSCSVSNIIAGIDWCKNNATLFNISVLTMSIGGGLFSDACNGQAEAAAANSAVNRGLFFSIASGNDGSSTEISSPACASNATAVGSVTSADAISSFSNRAPFMKILAPGSSITSTVPYSGATTHVSSTGVKTLSGTSMATPHVAGAAALLIQYKRLESNINLTPIQIESALNGTGANISDGSNTYKRINAFEALLSLDAALPNITFAEPTPANNTVTFNKSVLINITSIEALHTGLLEWNGTNQTMNGSAINRFSNKTSLGLGSYRYKVFGNDSAGNVAISEIRIVNVSNRKANSTATISSDDAFNRTNATLNGNWASGDIDGDSIAGNETKWYNNTIEVPELRNYTSIGPGNTTKNDNWTFSARVFDAYEYGNWSNSTVLVIQNTVPELGAISNITVNETDTVNANASGEVIASDVDNDALVINYSYPLNSSGQWRTLTNSSGTYTVQVNATDGIAVASRTVVITVIDQSDFDNDGVIDFYDTDDDGDQVNDAEDFIKGNISHVITTLTEANLTINRTSNISQVFNGSLEVKVFNGTNEYARFNFTFNSTSIIDLSNFTVEVNNGTLGSVAVRGITPSSRKTFFIDNLSRVHGVCLKDMPGIATVGSITGNCSGEREEFLKCPGAKGQYECTENGTRWRITGLNNTGIQQQNDTLPPKITSLSPSGAQTTSDTSIAVTLSAATDENATCRYSQMGNDTYSDMVLNLSYDSTWTEHTKAFTYTGDDSNETFYLLCNDTIGNVMTTANITAYTVDVGTGGATSGGGGSGGGGGAGGGGGKVTSLPRKAQYFSEIPVGTDAEIKIDSELLDLTKITFRTNKDVSDVTVVIEKINSSDTVQEENAYQYYRIRLEKFSNSDISEAAISFRVEKSWIHAGNYDENLVSIKRLVGSWTKLPTKQTSEDLIYFYYDSESPGFSDFAITSEKIVAEAAEEKENVSELPEFGEINITAKPEEFQPAPKGYALYWLALGIAILAILTFIFTVFRKKIFR